MFWTIFKICQRKSKKKKMDPQKFMWQEQLNMYISEITGYVELHASKILPTTFPIMDTDVIKELTTAATNLFKEEPSLLEVNSDIAIVGDLHGQIFDLIRVLDTCGMPDKQKYLFLGDIVDRGEFSIETIIVVFLLKVIWPENVLIIRGNHEFRSLCSNLGFLSQINAVYNDPVIFDCFIQSFSYIPFAALINGDILCVHGGIGPHCYSLDQFRSIQRPVEEADDDFLASIVWSDPSPDVRFFEQSAVRGSGYLFGAEAVEEFLGPAKLRVLIRGHECVADGIHKNFNDKVITVFTASNYCGCVENRSAVLTIKDNIIDFRTFKPLQWLKREDVIFKGHKGGRKVIRKRIVNTNSVRILPSIFEPQAKLEMPSPRCARNKMRRKSTEYLDNKIGSY